MNVFYYCFFISFVLLQTGKTENIQPVSLILDIPEEGVYKEEPLQKDETAKDNGSKISQPECQPLETLIVEKPEDNTVPTSNGHTERNFITPILQLFQRRGRILRSTQVSEKMYCSNLSSFRPSFFLIFSIYYKCYAFSVVVNEI